MKEALAPLVRAQQGVWLPRQALAAGYTPDQIRAAVDAGRWLRPFRGVLADPNRPLDTAQKLRALSLLTGHQVVATHHSAADLLGFGVVDDGRLHVLSIRDIAPRPGVVVHGTLLPWPDLVRIGPMRCTSPARTAADLMRCLDRGSALAVADAAMARGTTQEQVQQQLDRVAGHRGVVQARTLLPHADLRAESPMESRMRLMFIDGGILTLVPQVQVSDGRGRTRYRLDLAVQKLRIGAEYDGVESHTGPQWLLRDRERHGWLREQGWELVYVTSVHVYRQPHLAVSRMQRLISERLRVPPPW